MYIYKSLFSNYTFFLIQSSLCSWARWMPGWCKYCNQTLIEIILRWEFKFPNIWFLLNQKSFWSAGWWSKFDESCLCLPYWLARRWLFSMSPILAMPESGPIFNWLRRKATSSSLYGTKSMLLWQKWGRKWCIWILQSCRIEQ